MLLLTCFSDHKAADKKGQPGSCRSCQLGPQSRQSENRKGRETGVIAAPVDFPSPARKHLAHRRWRKLPVFCLILCSCSSRSISSEELTDMVVGMNETEEGERSFKRWSPVLSCLLWVILLEQGLGQGDQPPRLPPSITHPWAVPAAGVHSPSPETASCRSVFCGKFCAAELFSEYVVTGFHNTAVTWVLSFRKPMGLVLNVKT